MKKLTKNNQFESNLESNLELQYIFALSDKSPVSCHSIAGYLKNYPIPLPKTFLELNDFVKAFFTHIDSSKINKKHKTLIEDAEIYVAWRIWKQKRIKPKILILNKLCRDKAYLIGYNSLEELHKSASRISRVTNQIDDVIRNCKDEKLAERLEEIQSAVNVHAEIALNFYSKVLENYKECLKELDVHILDQQKLGGKEDEKK